MVQRNDSLGSACKAFEESLVLYYYGDCEGPEQDRVREHLGACGSCARFLEELRAFLPLMAEPKELPRNFWDDYYRELRRKLEALGEAEPWWKRLWSPLRPWAVPALGTALVVILALAFPVSRGLWRQQATDEAAPQEIRAVAKNLDFFETMGILESLDLLERLEEAGARKEPTQRL